MRIASAEWSSLVARVQVTPLEREVPGRGRGLRRRVVRRPLRRRECAEMLDGLRGQVGLGRSELGLDEQHQHGGGLGGPPRRLAQAAAQQREGDRRLAAGETHLGRHEVVVAVGQQRVGLLDPTLPQPKIGQPGDGLGVRHRPRPPLNSSSTCHLHL